VRGVEKVGKQVRFAEELEIGGEVMVPAMRKTPARYKLFGGMYSRIRAQPMHVIDDGWCGL
jgi:hypothetical protein